jgi:PPOX class probable F420-dependent enzyme
MSGWASDSHTIGRTSERETDMRTNLGADELDDLLERPLLAVLATRTSGDDVLLSPLWHEWRDGGFNVFTGSNDVKVRHIRRDPRVSIVVCEHQPPYRGVEVRASARVEPGDPETGRRIANRYIADGDKWVGPNDVVIRIEPGTVRAWDFKDDYP